MHIFLTALVLGSLPGAATQSDQCESAPTFPKPPPVARELAPDPPYETARHIAGYEDAYLGEGHLQPEGADHYYDWHKYVTIPLYRAPGGEQYGWINGGWVVMGAVRKPFTYAGTTGGGGDAGPRRARGNTHRTAYPPNPGPKERGRP